MKNHSTRVAVFTVLAIVALFFASIWIIDSLKSEERQPIGVSIIATDFLGYDFARAVADGQAKISIIVKPDDELRVFEPSNQDKNLMKDATLLIYTGSEFDNWVSDFTKESKPSQDNILNMSDYISDSLNENVKLDVRESVWTNLSIAKQIVSAIAEKLSRLYPERTTFFREKADLYNWQIEVINKQLKEYPEATNIFTEKPHISNKDFEAGKTYVDILRENLLSKQNNVNTGTE